MSRRIKDSIVVIRKEIIQNSDKIGNNSIEQNAHYLVTPYYWQQDIVDVAIIHALVSRPFSNCSLLLMRDVQKCFSALNQTKMFWSLFLWFFWIIHILTQPQKIYPNAHEYIGKRFYYIFFFIFINRLEPQPKICCKFTKHTDSLKRHTISVISSTISIRGQRKEREKECKTDNWIF